MHYIDGYVLPVAKKNLKAYTRMAAQGGKIWMRCGALAYVECVGDDLKKTKWTLPFTKLAKAKPGETVCFSYIVYRSRAHRDLVTKRAMKEMDKQPQKFKDAPMPFDMKRMAYGGFRTVVDL